MSAVEKFPTLLSDAEEESSAVAPCFSHEGINVRTKDCIGILCCFPFDLNPTAGRWPLAASCRLRDGVLCTWAQKTGDREQKGNGRVLTC